MRIGKRCFWTGLVIMLTHMICVANSDSLLHVLDQAIIDQHRYQQQKYDQINALKAQLTSPKNLSDSGKFAILNRLYFEYRSFQYDSAFGYAVKQNVLAYQMKDHAKITSAKLNLVFVLRSSGKYKEAFDSLETINSSQLSDALAIDYYEQLSRTNFDFAIYNTDWYYSPYNNRLGKLYADSALARCLPESLAYLRIGGLRAEAINDHQEALRMYESIIHKSNIDMHQYAMGCYSLGQINKAMGQEQEALDMIIMAATADLQSSVKETVALKDLAQHFYNQGDIDRAYRYIKQASDDANYYGARHRKLQVSSVLPVIEAAKLAQVEYQSKSRLLFLWGISIVSLVMVVFSLIFRKQYKQLKLVKNDLTLANNNLLVLNEKLLEANKIKEEYIGHSFSKDSEYLHKLDKFKQDIQKKLDEGKLDDLKQIVRMFSLKREQESLYTKFDELFLKLFPNFIPIFNSFFNPEDQFKVKSNQSMSIELRIFALIRIGISDHEHIASILGYSVQTIYNYKTKIKSKSILAKDDFENQLMEIKTF